MIRCCYKILFFLVTCPALISICSSGYGNMDEKPAREQIAKMLTKAGIHHQEIVVDSEMATITLVPAAKNSRQLLQHVFYSMGTAVRQSPWVSDVVIHVVLRNNAGLKYSCETETIVKFFTGKMSSKDFFSHVSLGSFGRGVTISSTPGEPSPQAASVMEYQEMDTLIDYDPSAVPESQGENQTDGWNTLLSPE